MSRWDRALRREDASLLPGRENLGQNLPQLPGEALFRRDAVILGGHALVVVQPFAVNGEHAAGLAHARDLLAGELPVDIARQGGEEADVFDVGSIPPDGGGR